VVVRGTVTQDSRLLQRYCLDQAQSARKAQKRAEDYVRRKRADGASWQAVGAALGITRQSAWERFRHLDASQKKPSPGSSGPYIPDVVLQARHLQPDEFEKLVTDAAKTDTELEQWLKASNIYISDALGYGVARPPINLLRAMARSRFLAIAAQDLVAPVPLAGSVSCPICRRFYLNEDFLRRHRARDHLEP
jgi:hypothetical protein